MKYQLRMSHNHIHSIEMHNEHYETAAEALVKAQGREWRRKTVCAPPTRIDPKILVPPEYSLFKYVIGRKVMQTIQAFRVGKLLPVLSVKEETTLTCSLPSYCKSLDRSDAH